MKKIILATLLVIFLLVPRQNVLAEDSFCLFYFTFIGCPNCAVTDPLVLNQWLEKYPNLVIIEYGWRGENWHDPNSKFFGDYAKKFHLQPAVPQIVIREDKNYLGRINVPYAETDIQQGEFNRCPLIDGPILFEDLDLSQLDGLPKIWANNKVLIALGNNQWLFQWNGKRPKILESLKFKTAKPQKVELSGAAFPNKSGFIPYLEFENAVKLDISDIPSISELMQPEKGFSQTKREKKEALSEEFSDKDIIVPFFGKLKTERLSLPSLTFLLGIADGFNPCAFFVLTFLLAALIGLAGARRKIFLVGGIFIFFSALFYFLFMAVLLNVFVLAEKIVFLTSVAGTIAIFVGIINIKDYFAFQKGISLTLPKGRKAKFLELVKNLSLAKSTLALIATTTIIAATVNIYELFCTVGFPMIFVRILTLRELPSWQYYLYLLFYNLVYVIPLAAIVLIFAITLGRKTFNQIWVRRLKLISGFMILSLGLILIIKPALLESISTAFLLVISSVLLGGIIIFICNRLKKE